MNYKFTGARYSQNLNPLLLYVLEGNYDTNQDTVLAEPRLYGSILIKSYILENCRFNIY